MLFNSIEFFIFLPTVYFLYWYLLKNNLDKQNLLLLFSSYFFYCWWDWRFLSLIILSTSVDYIIGLKIYNSTNPDTRLNYLKFSIFINLMILVIFKYFNFFIESFIDLFNVFSSHNSEMLTLNIILPIGISFYTFQTMSYTIDIYFKKLKPTNNLICFACFVSFFPQLVAGPIERAKRLLPQILNSRVYSKNNLMSGLRLILWGMFNKVVLADSLGGSVNIIFENYNSMNGGVLFLGLVYFAFQTYCDFSGYSYIAIGTANLFGFNLISNFNYPFFSINPIDFWKRWHISLSSWVQDYLYNPMALYYLRKKAGFLNKYKPHFFTMIIIGFWHGASWNFILFGAYWGAITCIYINFKSHFNKFNIPNLLSSLFVFNISIIGFLLFRSLTVLDSFLYFRRMITNIAIPDQLYNGLIFVVIIIILDLIHKDDDRSSLTFSTIKAYFNVKKIYFRKIVYFLVLSLIFWSIIIFLFKNNNQFIYFQF